MKTKMIFVLLVACGFHTLMTPALAASAEVAPNGTLTINNASLPISGLLSEEGKQVLMRTQATEGPGAPVPLPNGIADMAELRRVYNENLKPRVEHMRSVYPVDIEETTIDGISVAVVTPKGGVPAANRNRLMLNGPGGGFRTGVRGNGLMISIPVAALLKIQVVTITYRQGPEFQFPAASEDLLKVWNHYSKTFKPENIGMVGCSAGGSLIAQTTAMLIKAGRPTPAVLGVYCAGLGEPGVGDANFFGALAVNNVAAAAALGVQTTATAGPAASSSAERTYYTGIDMNQFIVSPTVDENLLKQFPPTIFFTATRDFAMRSAAYSYRKLVKLGIDSQLLIFDGLYHGFMTNPDFPEAQEGYSAAAKFFDKHLGK